MQMFYMSRNLHKHRPIPFPHLGENFTAFKHLYTALSDKFLKHRVVDFLFFSNNGKKCVHLGRIVLIQVAADVIKERDHGLFKKSDLFSRCWFKRGELVIAVTLKRKNC